MRIALTREVSPSIERCEITHVVRKPIDLARAREQHDAYERCLAELGCKVERLPAMPKLPDAVFVEDTAVVLDELAIISRPGAESRRAETESVAQALAPHRELFFIEAPATLDGGDVLKMGRTLFVGESGRTNPGAIEQLCALVEPYGYEVVTTKIGQCLHLKSAVTQVAPDTVLVNPAWVAPSSLGDMEFVEVDPSEELGANALLVGDTLVYPAEYPLTRERLENRGLRVQSVPTSELLKAEGGVTCSSLLIEP